MIIDTSALFAYFDAADPRHAAVDAVIVAANEPLIVSPYVVAELDYLITARRGIHAEIASLNELSGGAWDLPAFDRDDLTKATEVIHRYRDQNIGVADASLVVLASRYNTRTIATLDRRHFEVLRPLQGGRFDIVP